MLKVILYGLLIWFLYNLIFRFIIPIYKTTREVKEKFRQMQSHMQDNAPAAEDFTARPQQKETSKVPKEDYLDFEEIK